MIRLKFSTLGLTLLALNWANVQVWTAQSPSASTTGDLVVEPSSTPIPGGKASLKIGVLIRQAAAYVGDYQFKVTPYFFKSEKGKLSIDVSDEILKKLASGKAVEFSGQATTSGSGETRRFIGKATPLDQKRGTVSLQFVAGKTEMLFITSYCFDEPRKPSH